MNERDFLSTMSEEMRAVVESEWPELMHSCRRDSAQRSNAPAPEPGNKRKMGKNRIDGLALLDYLR
jgi:hypothetical protein